MTQPSRSEPTLVSACLLGQRPRYDGRDSRDPSLQAVLSNANMKLRVARENRMRHATLREGSPSCGLMPVSRLGKKVAGRGDTAALLARSGLRVEGRS